MTSGASLYDSGLYWCTVVTRGWRAIVAAWSRGLLLNTALGRYAWERAAQIAPGKVQAVARVVMPDHGHLCFTIKGWLPNAETTLSGRWVGALEEEAHRCVGGAQDERLWEDKSVVDAGDYAETF